MGFVFLFVVALFLSALGEINCPKALNAKPYVIKSGVGNRGVATNFQPVATNQCLKGARILVGVSGLGTLNVYEQSTRNLLVTTNATFLAGINNTIPFSSKPLTNGTMYTLELVGEMHLGEAYLRVSSFPIKSVPKLTYQIMSCSYTTLAGKFPTQPCTTNTLAYIDPVICDCNAACSTNNDCVACTTNSCEWCLPSSSCIESGGICSSHVSQPKYCPISSCSSYSSCSSCTQTKGKCSWCLDASMCVEADSTCHDKIGEHQFCPAKPKKVSIL